MFGRKPVLVQIEANLAWVVARDPVDGHWFGVCQAINANAAGDTWEDFQACANEAMALLFGDLYASGELEAFLARNHWRAETPLPAPGTIVKFDVPFTIERRNRVEELIGAGR